MTSKQLRKAFLNFFKERGHIVAPSSSLLPDDPSVLLTTAGMQQFKKYYTGELDPIKDFGLCRAASVQKCFRTSDIEEVGDERHLTFFEMLGNFSFTSPLSPPLKGGEGEGMPSPSKGEDGNDSAPKSPPYEGGGRGGCQEERASYSKKEAIAYALDFLQTIGLKDKIDYVTVFGGDGETSPDEEAYKIWQEFGMPEEKIKKFGRADNFWGPTGASGPCGPTTEIYVQGVEVWNLVFNEYYARSDGRLEKAAAPGIDTGMGLERLAMVSQGASTIFETDLFKPLIETLEAKAGKSYLEESRYYRIVIDHIRGACFLIADGVLPSNLAQGYVLRRILRRVIRSLRLLQAPEKVIYALVEKVIELYGEAYPELRAKASDISVVIKCEIEKFSRALDRGLKEFEQMASPLSPPYSTQGACLPARQGSASGGEGGAKGGVFSGKDAFMLYESYGFPIEMTREMLQERGLNLNEAEFQEEFKKHQELSRLGVEKKFGGHGIVLDTGELKAANQEELQKVIRLHTATHLLQQALRQILGPEISQRGSDITAERARFDFTFSRKVALEELKKLEDLVNQKIQEDLPVSMQEMKFEDAVASGALAFFKGKYPPVVKVYSIGAFSKEICGGPHVNRTSEIGKFKILKEEASSAGVRRIRAVVE
jgi:alanyl-tRNA synthetase